VRADRTAQEDRQADHAFPADRRDLYLQLPVGRTDQGKYSGNREVQVGYRLTRLIDLIADLGVGDPELRAQQLQFRHGQRGKDEVLMQLVISHGERRYPNKVGLCRLPDITAKVHWWMSARRPRRGRALPWPWRW